MENYREWLKETFAVRCKKNPSYSLRAFARDLGLFPSHLCDVFNGKQGLSRKTAIRIADTIKLKESEKQLFVTMVDAEHSRNPSQRKRAVERLEKLKITETVQKIGADTFNVISDWYHFALLDLMETVEFVPDMDWIAKRLEITKDEASRAVERLVSIGLLEMGAKGWIKTRQFPSVFSDIPSEPIRKYHRALLQKAEISLTTHPMETRDFSSMSIPIDPSDLDEIAEDIRVFRRSLDNKYKLRARKNAVYALCIQFFSLTDLEGNASSDEKEAGNA